MATEKEQRLERWARAAMSVVKVRDADDFRTRDDDQDDLAELTATFAFDFAEAMEREYQKRLATPLDWLTSTQPQAEAGTDMNQASDTTEGQAGHALCQHEHVGTRRAR